MIFKIGFQHHAVTRLTVAHMLDGVVNFRIGNNSVVGATLLRAAKRISLRNS